MNKIYTIGFGVICFGAGYLMNEVSLFRNEKPIEAKVKKVSPITDYKAVSNLASASTTLKPITDDLQKTPITKSEQMLLDSDNNEKVTVNKALPKWFFDGKDTISKEDSETIFPKPYADIIASTGGMMINYLKQHYTDDIDFNWGVTMEQNISDFVLFHQKSLDVELQLITCKSTTCELRVLEKEKYSWNFIADDLRLQEWYEFSSSASSEDLGQDGTYLLIMLSK